MNIDSYIAKFLMEDHEDLKQKQQMIEVFNKEFTKEKLERLTYKDYVLGKDNYNAYSYWLEYKLHSIGSIKGGAVTKHGVWFSKKENKLKWTKKFEQSDYEPIELVKELLLKLRNHGDHMSFEEIEKESGSTTLKYKSLYLFYPDRFLPMFSEFLYDYYLKKNGISIENMKGLGQKQDALLKWKSSYELLDKMSPAVFTKFLYYYFGKPRKEKDNSNKVWIDGGIINEDVQSERSEHLNSSYKVNENPQIKNRSPKRIGNNATPYKPDYDSINQRRSLIGETGERKVMQYEKDRLKNSQHRENIKRVSENDDGAGYDIMSFEENGEPRYIEVKTTTSINNVDFYLTRNELETMEKHENYWVYVVTGIYQDEPVISPFEKSKLKELELVPVLFKAAITL